MWVLALTSRIAKNRKHNEEDSKNSKKLAIQSKRAREVDAPFK
jgi:hypothetical protein